MTTPETPADLLRRAVRRLDLLAAPLADHAWEAETDEDDEDEWVIASEGPIMQTGYGPVMLGGQWTVARDVPENVARWAGLVLYRCSRCGRHKTDEVDGIWTTQQLRGGPTVSELLQPPRTAVKS